MPDTLTWTLLPNGIDPQTGRAKLSLVAHPSISSVTGELNDTPFSDWPALLASVGTWQVHISEGEQFLPAQPVPVADSTVWRDLFTLTGPVRTPPGPADVAPLAALSDTLDHARTQTAVTGLYASALATSPTALIGPEHPVARQLARLGAALAGSPDGTADTASGVAGDVGDMRVRALVDAARAVGLRPTVAQKSGVVVPPAPAPLDGIGEVEHADFHQVVTLLRDHPTVARLLGIVVDFTVPVTQSLRGEKTIRITTPTGPPLHASFGRVDTPWSRTICDPNAGVFTMATRPGPGTEIVRGMVDLTPDNPKYVVSTVDLTGSVRQLAAQGARLHRAGVDASSTVPAPQGLPARRDTGFTVAQSGRLTGSVKHAAEAQVRYDGPDGRIEDQPVLFADDVTAGYRVDVRRGVGPFRSLMRRVAQYSIGPTTTKQFVVHDEGMVEPIVAVQQATPGFGHSLTVSEEIAGWAGYSMGAGMPGLAVTAEKAGQGTVAAVKAEPAPGYPFLVTIKAEPGSLERLRYGQEYSFRLRATDLGGNSLSPELADRADTKGFASAPVRFGRTETLAAPVMLLRSPLRAGETLQKLVVTSDGDGNPLQPVTRRHLAPPSTVPQLVERHGLFDAAFGPQATVQTRDRMLALASRESGTFSDPVVPRPGGGTMPSPGLTVVDPAGSPATLPLPPGQPLPAGQYLVHDTDNPVVPYLIDPGARGATLAAVPGQPVTAGSAPATVAYSGQWPDQVPAELRLVAGGQAGQGRSPVLAANPGGRGTLTVTLPPASEARLLLSSALAAAALDVMDPVSGSVRDAALGGLVPLFSPAQPITVLHATRRPLKQLTWSDTAVTITGPTRVRFAATATAHRPSTAGLELLATWDEIVDPGFGPVTTVPRSAVLGSIDVPSDGTETLTWNKEYDFGDTKRRDLSLSVIGSTRYRDCFPELTEGDPRGQRVLIVPSKIRKNTRRPEPPEIAAIVPTYRWVRSAAGGVYTSTRERAGVRVWLRRPWMTTGPGEALGVVVWSSLDFAAVLQNTPFNMQQMSRWGVDLLEEKGPRPDQPFTAGSFPAGEAHREELVEISSFNETPGNPPATVVAHEVRFDPERQQWFADVDVDIPGGRPALLRLGLVRYQPESPGGARVSRMVTSDWIPLQAPRTMTIRSLSSTGIDYDVSLTGKHVEDRAFIAELRWRAFPTPAGAPAGSPTDITIDNNQISKAMGVTPTPDGTFFAQARLIGSNDPAAVARYRGGRIVVREQHFGYKIRTDDTISRTEWLDVVDVADIPQPQG